MNRLLENSKVQVTSAVLALVFLVGICTGEVAWKVSVTRDLREIRAKQDILGWHRADMERWVLKTELLNHEWNGADVDRLTER